MHNNPLVTVICLCYNHAEFVIEALESVLNQTHANVELIIADDFSTDNSVEVIKNWLQFRPEIQYVFNTENKGNTKTFNSCLALSKGEYIIDLAADDVLKLDCIAKQLKGFAESSYENLGLVYGNAKLINEKGTSIENYFPTDKFGNGIEKPSTGNIYINLLNGKTKVCSISAMIKRTVFEQLKGYDENLAYEDYDLWIRAARIYNFDYIDEILTQKRVLHDSMYTLLKKKNNKRTRQFNYSTYLIMKKAFALNRNKAEFKAMLKRTWVEMKVANYTRDYRLLFKYGILDLKILLKIISIK